MTSSTLGAAIGISNNLFSLYVSDVIDLAKTMVIKLDQVGQALNALVMQKSGTNVDPEDRTTWKYYQNISGTYNFTDTPMLVESLDTGTLISFDRTTLPNHPLTTQAYKYGSYYYNELVTKYPDQEMLILGIVYPCDMAQAIAAEDGTILTYPDYLVEEFERDWLIPQLQIWLYQYLNRWVVKPFAYSDNLYIATYLGQLSLMLVPAIMNTRLRACKTNQAHSFHIGQYLRSHGFLDFYLAELTREQTLAFYRNINYYRRNAGFTTTFEELVDLLMTKRGLPLYEYVFRHKAGAINYTEVENTTDLLPKALFKREPLNSPARAAPLTDFNLSDVFGLTAFKAPGNDDWQLAHQSDVEEVFDRADTALLRTKVVESTLSPTAQAQVQAPQFVVFNHWLALAMDGTYTAPFEYTPPGSSIPIELTQQDAVALWIYAMSKALDPITPPDGYVPLQFVPQLTAIHVAKHTLPTFTDLRGLTLSRDLPDGLLQQMIGLAVSAPNALATIDVFKQFCTDVYESQQTQFFLAEQQEDPATRAQLEYVKESFVEDVLGQLTEHGTGAGDTYVGQTYLDFLSQVGFTPASYSQLDYYNLTTSLYEAATGTNLNAIDNPLNVQAAMIALLETLSSYSVLVVSNTNPNDVLSLTRPEVRLYNYSTVEVEEHFVQGADIQIDTINFVDSSTINYDWEHVFPLSKPTAIELMDFELLLEDMHTDHVTWVETVPSFVHVSVLMSTDDAPADELFNALTLQQRQTLAALGTV